MPVKPTTPNRNEKKTDFTTLELIDISFNNISVEGYGENKMSVRTHELHKYIAIQGIALENKILRAFPIPLYAESDLIAELSH